MNHNPFLVTAALLSAVAAALHFACIAFGPSWFRFLGAGERMAQAAQAGSWYPAAITATIAAVLAIWSLYALSAAGVIPPLPFLRPMLCAITGVYLLRGMIFLPVLGAYPGRTVAFWWWSSAICLAIGMVHLIGLMQVWTNLPVA